jgi:hypothetical protein
MSNRHGNDGESTYGSVRDRYRQWSEERPRPRSGSAISMPELPEGATRLLALAVGLGTGIFLLALAATAYYASGTWGEIERGGALVAYFLTGLFLTIAGLGCILATLNHLFRVLAGPPAHH